MITIIPLGNNCSVAYNLQKYQKRNQAFPFDWLRSNFKNIVKCLKQEFQDFFDFDLKNKKIKSGFDIFDPEVEQININSEKKSIFIKNKYNFEFVHDFNLDLDLENQTVIVTEKYQRRIARFYQTLKSNNDVIFISNDNKIKISDLIEFRDIILKINQRIKILFINVSSEKPNYDLLNLENFRFVQYFLSNHQSVEQDWRLENLPWQLIFNLNFNSNRRIKISIDWSNNYSDTITDLNLLTYIRNQKLETQVNQIVFQRSNYYNLYYNSNQSSENKIKNKYFEFDYYLSFESFTQSCPNSEHRLHQFLIEQIADNNNNFFIGGQSPIFVKKFGGLGVTDSENIYKDALYNKIGNIELVNYRNISLTNSEILVVNISRKGLRNLAYQVIKHDYRKIIQIGCDIKYMIEDYKKLYPKYRVYNIKRFGHIIVFIYC